MTALRLIDPEPDVPEPVLAWHLNTTVDPWMHPGLYAAESVLAPHAMDVDMVVGRCRSRRASAARRAVVRVLIRAGWGVCEVARLLGRDHSTVCHYAKEAR